MKINRKSQKLFPRVKMAENYNIFFVGEIVIIATFMLSICCHECQI